jgi:hypothetical protein
MTIGDPFSRSWRPRMSGTAGVVDPGADARYATISDALSVTSADAP